MTISGGPGAPPISPWVANDMMACHPAALVALVSPGMRRLSVTGGRSMKEARGLSRLTTMSTFSSLPQPPSSTSLPSVVCPEHCAATSGGEVNSDSHAQHVAVMEQSEVRTREGDETPSPGLSFVAHHTTVVPRRVDGGVSNGFVNGLSASSSRLHGMTQLRAPTTAPVLLPSHRPNFAGKTVIVDYINHQVAGREFELSRCVSDTTLVSRADSCGVSTSSCPSDCDLQDADCNRSSISSASLQDHLMHHRDVIWTSANSLELRLSPVLGLRVQDSFSDCSNLDAVV